MDAPHTETVETKRISFEGVELLAEPCCFVMPQCFTYFLTGALRRTGIDFAAYSYRDLASGRAPITIEDVIEPLEHFFGVLGDDADNCTTIMPCVIVSRVSERDMLERARLLFSQPMDPDVLACRHQIERHPQELVMDGYFTDREQNDFCFDEATVQLWATIEEWVKTAELGDIRVFATLLDPNLYDEQSVAGMGMCRDPLTSAMGVYESTQCCLQLRRADNERGYEELDGWADMLATTIRRVDDISLEDLRATEGYQEGSPLYQAYLERSIKREHIVPMRLDEMDGVGEIIALSEFEEGRVVLELVAEKATMLMVTDSTTMKAIPSEYSALAEQIGVGRGEIVDLDEPQIWEVFSNRYPQLAEAVRDLRDIQQDRKLERQKELDERFPPMEVQVDGMTGMAHVDEDTFYPMTFGLYFPARPEGQNIIAYDAPEAAPYIKILEESGWEGQMWVTLPFDIPVPEGAGMDGIFDYESRRRATADARGTGEWV